ncbi:MULTISPECIES: hypothetical protein [Sphingomonas]|uniref:hypothetical protein n=1 Tax=Sphingomonas TaxID=13687 RepID=UPI001269B279|nr:MULTISPECIES: hypothetical protein [Sphingomonas]
MMDSDRVGIVAIDWTLALLLAAATGWSALRAGIPLLVGGAALVGFAMGLWAMRWAGSRPRRFALPTFALPEFPNGAVEALPEGVVRLPLRPLPTPGELEARIQRHMGQRPAQAAEVVPLHADAGAALRQALAGLRQARP